MALSEQLNELLAKQDDLETRIRALPVFGTEPIRDELADVQAQIAELQGHPAFETPIPVDAPATVETPVQPTPEPTPDQAQAG